MDRCYRCGGKLEDRAVTIEDIILGHKVIAKHVPAKVCVECGEELISGKLLESLEEYITQRLKAQDKTTLTLNNDRRPIRARFDKGNNVCVLA